MVDEREMDADSPDAFNPYNAAEDSPSKKDGSGRTFLKPLGQVNVIGGLKTVTGVNAAVAGANAIANMAKRKTAEEIEKEAEE